MSDSIAAAFLLGTPRKRYGVSVGGVNHQPGSPQFTTHIDVFDVDAAPPILVPFQVDPDEDTIPTDLFYSLAAKRIFVRCQAPPEEAPPAKTGRDVAVVRFDATGTPLLEVGAPFPLPQIGGRGHMDNINMADTMIVNGRRAVSVSEALNNLAGWVHTVLNQ